MCIKAMKFTSAICFSILVFAAISLRAQVCSPAPVGLVSWWAADGNALDSRSRSNGTLVSNAGFTAGQVGQAFNFDGNNDSIQIPHNANLNISGDFTAEAWIFPRTLPNIAPRIFEKDNGAGGLNWRLVVANEGATLNALSFGSGLIYLVTPNNSITLNQWNHVAVTVSASNGIKLYVNGIELASTPQTASTSNNAPLIIGDDLTGTREFDGLIDESAIYNRALSVSEIQAIFNAGQSGKCKPTATLAPSGQILWLAGDGNANDSAGTNNATLQNGASHAVGKIGQSFNFTAQNQFVNIPNNPALFPSTALTVEAWVNPSTYAGCPLFYRIFHTIQNQLRGYITAIDCSNQKFVGRIFDSSGASDLLYSNGTIPTGKR